MFLNPERVSMPDVDSDFCYERRQEVIDYVVKKYGKDNVSQIITFGTMAAKMCIRDVGRAMDYSYAEVDRVAKMIPTALGMTIDKALESNPEFKDIYNSDNRVKELVDISRRLEGLPRQASTHACRNSNYKRSCNRLCASICKRRHNINTIYNDNPRRTGFIKNGLSRASYTYSYFRYNKISKKV